MVAAPPPAAAPAPAASTAATADREPTRSASWMRKTFGPPPPPIPKTASERLVYMHTKYGPPPMSAPEIKEKVQAKRRSLGWLLGTQGRSQEISGASMSSSRGRARSLEIISSALSSSSSPTESPESSQTRPRRASQPVLSLGAPPPALSADDSRVSQMTWLKKFEEFVKQSSDSLRRSRSSSLRSSTSNLSRWSSRDGDVDQSSARIEEGSATDGVGVGI